MGNKPWLARDLRRRKLLARRVEPMQLRHHSLHSSQLTTHICACVHPNGYFCTQVLKAPLRKEHVGCSLVSCRMLHRF